MAKQPDPAFAFILSALKRSPTTPYSAVAEKAKAAGHMIYPIMYGRAKAVLGLVPVKPRKDRKAPTTSVLPPIEAKVTRTPKAAKVARNGDDPLRLAIARLKALEKLRAGLENLLKQCDPETTF